MPVGPVFSPTSRKAGMRRKYGFNLDQMYTTAKDKGAERKGLGDKGERTCGGAYNQSTAGREQGKRADKEEESKDKQHEHEVCRSPAEGALLERLAVPQEEEEVECKIYAERSEVEEIGLRQGINGVSGDRLHYKDLQRVSILDQIETLVVGHRRAGTG